MGQVAACCLVEWVDFVWLEAGRLGEGFVYFLRIQVSAGDVLWSGRYAEFSSLFAVLQI